MQINLKVLDLFNPCGRVDRIGFIVCFFLIIVFWGWFFEWYTFDFRGYTGPRNVTIIRCFVNICAVLTLTPIICRRLHDIGFSSIWCVFIWLYVLSHNYALAEMHVLGGGISDIQHAAHLFSMVLLGVSLLIIGSLFFKEGGVAANKWGHPVKTFENKQTL